MTRALVIDDDLTVRAVVGRTLRRAGYETMEAPDAGTGLQLFNSQAFDLAIVDIFMPGQGGLTTIAQIRERWPSVKILAVSGADRLEMAAHAQAVGADAFLKKPFEAQTFLNTIDALLKGPSSRPPEKTS